MCDYKPQSLLLPFWDQSCVSIRLSYPLIHNPIIPESSYLQSGLCWCSSNSADTAFPSSSPSCSGSRTDPSPATLPGLPGNPYWPTWCSCPCLPDTASWSWSDGCIFGPGYTSRWLLNSPLSLGAQTQREQKSPTWRTLAHLCRRVKRNGGSGICFYI